MKRLIRKKRLIKKAFEKVTLYHGTSSQYFRYIASDGYIQPRTVTDNSVSGGKTYEGKIWYPDGAADYDNKQAGVNFESKNVSLSSLLLQSYKGFGNSPGYDPTIRVNSNMKQTLIDNFSTILEKYPDTKTYLSNKYVDYIHTMTDSGFGLISKYLSEDASSNAFLDELNNTTLPILEISYKAEADDYVVYLASEESVERYGTQSAVMGAESRNLPNFGCVLTINADADALAADFVDSTDQLDFFASEPLWKQSLNAIGQVVHHGPISFDNISSVRFISQYLMFTDLVFDSRDEFKNWASQYIQWDTDMNANDAAQGIENIYSELDKMLSNTNTDKQRDYY